MIRLLIASLLIPFMAHAGDGGYTIHACTSGSGRTQINVFQDNYSGSDRPITIRLIIDGQMAEYASEDNQSRNIVNDWDNGTIVVFERGQLVLSLERTDRSIVIKRGYKDPRVGTPMNYYANNGNDITTTCTRYEQGP